jgi:FKBP-type peptidyl-prolyl cis-trans isomerase FkpA
MRASRRILVKTKSFSANRLSVVALVVLLMTLVGCMTRPPGPRDSEIAQPADDQQGAHQQGAHQQFEPGAEDADAPQEFTKTESGLQYRILRKSDGPKPKASSNVTCHYRGWLNDGQVFDASYKKGDPISFSLSGVVKGWTEGVQLVGEGGMIELKIPYQLGYGEEGRPPRIPAKAELNFIVELIKIN